MREESTMRFRLQLHLLGIFHLSIHLFIIINIIIITIGTQDFAIIYVVGWKKKLYIYSHVNFIDDTFIGLGLEPIHTYHLFILFYFMTSIHYLLLMKKSYSLVITIIIEGKKKEISSVMWRIDFWGIQREGQMVNISG